MRRIGKLVWILVLAAILLVQTAFAAPEVASVKLNQVQQIGSAGLTMYVNMRDSAGNPVEGKFRPDQFEVSVDGNLLPIEEVQKFDSTKQGIHYVFCVDVSGSMIKPVRLDIPMKESMANFIKQMGPLDTVSIYTFGNDVKDLLSGSKSNVAYGNGGLGSATIMNARADQEAILAAIDSIEATEGNTALYAGVVTGVQCAAKALGSNEGRSAVIVITDGTNDVEKAAEAMKSFTKESIDAEVVNAQVPLYCVGLSDNDNKNTGNAGVDRASLGEFAEKTGGEQYIIISDKAEETMGKIRSILQSTLVLKGTLVNADGRTGFAETSTFMVGYESDSGLYAYSNELEQNINWNRVPAPALPPAISIELDDEEIVYMGDNVSITGLIIVEQGEVERDDLSISVNGEIWPAELKLNGTNYTFTAEGLISSNAKELKVQAEITELEVSSSVASIEVIQPTTEPTATPAPVLTVELDDTGRDILFVPGNMVSISGVVNVQGEINPNELKLFINEEGYEMTVSKINHSQYEFKAECTLPEEVLSELSIKVQLDGTDIYSRVQKLFLATPSPTPNPELSFFLNDAGIEYMEGEPITIRGSIEVLSGEVDPEDIALYVNNVGWSMKLEEVGAGAYSFTATNTLADSNITQLNVKVGLKSNRQVVTAMEKLAVLTVTPEPTATPTPRPTATPPITAAPTAAPATAVPTATVAPETVNEGDIMGQIMALINPLIDNGMIWIVVGVLVLIIILIIVLIIIKSRKKGVEPVSVEGTSFSVMPRDNSDMDSSKTTREGAYGDEAEATVRSEKDGHSDFITGTDKDKNDWVGTDHFDDFPKKSSTSGKTQRIEEVADGTQRIDEEADGTQRIDEGAEGTQRIEIREIEITMDEFCNGESRGPRKIYIECDGKKVLGRSSSADVVINDRTVSSEHLKITYDGDEVRIVDMGSTNGTKLNGKKIPRNEPQLIASGDSILIGSTTLKLSFDTSDMY